MKRLWLIVPVVLALGCNEQDQDKVKFNAGISYATAKNAVTTAWGSFMKEASKVTADSSHAALEQAKQQTARLQEQLGKIEIKSPIDQAQLDAAQNQMEKIQAAMNLKSLQEQSQTAVQNAIATGKLAQASYEDASRKLAELDAGYRDLKEKLDAAQMVYDQASQGLQDAVKKVQSLGGM